MKNAEEKKLDEVYSALSHSHRRAMIYRLSMQPMTITLLAEERGLSLPAMHKHVKILEKANLIQRKKVGRCNFLALKRNGLSAGNAWLAQFHTYWGSNQESLDNYVKVLQEKDNL